MVNKRKMIDADKHFSFVYKLSHNKELLSYFVTNLSGKIVNFCKLPPKAENVTGRTIVTVKSSGLYFIKIQFDSQFPLFPSPNYS